MCGQVLFTCGIYHTSKHFYVCVSMCACNHMALLKKPDTRFYIGDSGTEFHVDYNHIRT